MEIEFTAPVISIPIPNHKNNATQYTLWRPLRRPLSPYILIIPFVPFIKKKTVFGVAECLRLTIWCSHHPPN